MLLSPKLCAVPSLAPSLRGSGLVALWDQVRICLCSVVNRIIMRVRVLMSGSLTIWRNFISVPVVVSAAAFVPFSHVVALLQEEIRTRCTSGIWATSNVRPEFPRALTVALHLSRYHAKRRHSSLQLVRSGPARRREILVHRPPLV